MKLNIGCGNTRKPGYVGVDIISTGSVDVIADIEASYLPFLDNSITLVYSHHVLEHLNNLIGTMREIHRILIPSGLCEIIVPHWSTVYAWSDPTHCRVFSSYTFRYFCSDEFIFYGLPAFEVRYSRIMYHMKITSNKGSFVKALKPYSVILDFLANKNVDLCERFWCFWVGGFEQLHVILSRRDMPTLPHESSILFD